MSFWCQHIWTAYHCTEVLYFNRQKTPVLRWFEVCQTCQAKRVLEDANPNEERKEAP